MSIDDVNDSSAEGAAAPKATDAQQEAAADHTEAVPEQPPQPEPESDVTAEDLETMVQEGQENIAKAFAFVQAKRTVEVPLNIRSYDEEDREVFGVMQVKVTRWGMTKGLVYSQPLQRVWNALLELAPHVSGMKAEQKAADNTRVQFPVRKFLEHADMLGQALTKCWADVMAVVVGALHYSNKDTIPEFKTEKSTRQFLEDYCDTNDMFELVIVVTALNAPTPPSKQKGSKKKSLLQSLASRQS